MGGVEMLWYDYDRSEIFYIVTDLISHLFFYFLFFLFFAGAERVLHLRMEMPGDLPPLVLEMLDRTENVCIPWQGPTSVQALTRGLPAWTRSAQSVQRIAFGTDAVIGSFAVFRGTSARHGTSIASFVLCLSGQDCSNEIYGTESWVTLVIFE